MDTAPDFVNPQRNTPAPFIRHPLDLVCPGDRSTPYYFIRADNGIMAVVTPEYAQRSTISILPHTHNFAYFTAGKLIGSVHPHTTASKPYAATTGTWRLPGTQSISTTAFFVASLLSRPMLRNLTPVPPLLALHLPRSL